MTNLELLAERPDDRQASALLAEALDQARGLRTLTNDLLDLSRTGETPAHTEQVRLDVLAERVTERAARDRDADRDADREHGPTRTTADCRPVLLHGDPDALERAIANLVDNAVKFTPAGSVTVTVEERDGCGVVEVGDTGPGIPEADLPYVFDRFHRSPAARALPGSGLGLAIVRQIATAHGGTVEAVPQPRGARLRLTLPLARSGSGESAARRGRLPGHH